MNEKNQSSLDPIDFIRQAKPEKTSEFRVEHLIQQSESKTTIKYRSPNSAKTKFALLASPALVALLVFQGVNLYTGSHTLSLDLSGKMSPSLSYPLGSSSAYCAYANRKCEDWGIDWGIDWKYSISPNVSKDSPDGPVYSLSRFGQEKDLAKALALELGIDRPISSNVTEDSTTLFSAGSREDQLVDVGYSSSETYISYVNQAGKDWIRCQSASYRSTQDCSSVTFENSLSESEAATYAQGLLNKIGLSSSTDISSLEDGDYFLQVTKTESNPIQNHQQNMLLVSAQLVLNGEPTHGGIEFYWFKGSKELFMINGVLYKAEAKGTFRTLNAEQALVRLNKYVTLPNVKEPFTPSQKSIEGMPWDQSKKFYDIASGESDPLIIDVTITRTEIGLVTIYDSKGKAWVVPGIHYFDESGYLGSATSLDGDYIKMDATEE